jgi:hypothetical protein
MLILVLLRTYIRIRVIRAAGADDCKWPRRSMYLILMTADNLAPDLCILATVSQLMCPSRTKK